MDGPWTHRAHEQGVLAQITVDTGRESAKWEICINMVPLFPVLEF